MVQSLDQNQFLSIEIAALNAKMDFLNTDRIAKECCQFVHDCYQFVYEP